MSVRVIPPGLVKLYLHWLKRWVAAADIYFNVFFLDSIFRSSNFIIIINFAKNPNLSSIYYDTPAGLCTFMLVYNIRFDKII